MGKTAFFYIIRVRPGRSGGCSLFVL